MPTARRAIGWNWSRPTTRICCSNRISISSSGAATIRCSAAREAAPVADSESAADLDGTEEGTKGGATYTTPKPDIWSTADGAADGDVIAGDLYLKNRNMTGWEVRRIAEHPGTVRLNKSASGSHKYSGYLKTPKLAALTAPTNITLEFDICRFAGRRRYLHHRRGRRNVYRRCGQYRRRCRRDDRRRFGNGFRSDERLVLEAGQYRNKQAVVACRVVDRRCDGRDADQVRRFERQGLRVGSLSVG